jgi:hypothetical protein
MQSEWNEPYNSMFQDVSPASCCEIYQDEHMMSLFSQQAAKKQNTDKQF